MPYINRHVTIPKGWLKTYTKEEIQQEIAIYRWKNPEDSSYLLSVLSILLGRYVHEHRVKQAERLVASEEAYESSDLLTIDLSNDLGKCVLDPVNAQVRKLTPYERYLFTIIYEQGLVNGATYLGLSPSTVLRLKRQLQQVLQDT